MDNVQFGDEVAIRIRSSGCAVALTMCMDIQVGIESRLLCRIQVGRLVWLESKLLELVEGEHRRSNPLPFSVHWLKEYASCVGMDHRFQDIQPMIRGLVSTIREYLH